MMRVRDDELIAIALGDVEPSPQLKRRLEAAEDRRELESYRKALSMLDEMYGDAALARAKRTVYYTVMRTPVGRLFIAATDAGLVRVSFDANEASFVADLRQQLKRNVIKSVEKTADIVSQLEAYFTGKRRAFDIPVDLSQATPFQRSVLMAARGVSLGQVTTYGEIAKRIGRPKASRAVGQALGHNPIPIVIPCHRVVPSGGGLGGYSGGLSIKRRLLEMEGAYK